MTNKRLATGSLLGIVAAVMFYIATLILLFMPVCTVSFEVVGGSISPGDYLLKTQDFTGWMYLANSGVHIALFVISLVLCAAVIPMFGDAQCLSRHVFLILRFILLTIALSCMIAFMFVTSLPLETMQQGRVVSLNGYTLLGGGFLFILLTFASLALLIVSTVLCAVEKNDVRRTVFLSNAGSVWRVEEVLLSIFTAIIGGIVGTFPFIFTKIYWKKKYVRPLKENGHEKSTIRKTGGILNYYTYAAKLLPTYKELLNDGTITEEEYEAVKKKLLNGE